MKIMNIHLISKREMANLLRCIRFIDVFNIRFSKSTNNQPWIEIAIINLIKKYIKV